MTCEVKGDDNKMANSTGNYTVVVDGQKFNVSIAEGNADIQVTPAAAPAPAAEAPAAAPAPAAAASAGGTEVGATVSGNVWKIIKNVGDDVKAGEVIMILEAMKMEIDIEAPVDGKIASINVNPNDAVTEGQVLATM